MTHGYQSVYVIATKEKVILDFEVTDRLPTIEALMLLFIRIKVAVAHPAASNGVCSRHRSGFSAY